MRLTKGKKMVSFPLSLFFHYYCRYHFSLEGTNSRGSSHSRLKLFAKSGVTWASKFSKAALPLEGEKIQEPYIYLREASCTLCRAGARDGKLHRWAIACAVS